MGNKSSNGNNKKWNLEDDDDDDEEIIKKAAAAAAAVNEKLMQEADLSLKRKKKEDEEEDPLDAYMKEIYRKKHNHTTVPAKKPTIHIKTLTKAEPMEVTAAEEQPVKNKVTVMTGIAKSVVSSKTKGILVKILIENT